MNEAILVAPRFDEATKFSYEWSREVKAWLEEKNYTVYDVGGRRVTRAEVEKLLREHPNILYIHYDHGSEDAHWGSESEKLVDLNNVELLSGRPTYTMNCLSAKKLGVRAHKEGALAYHGEVESFAFSTEALDEFKEFANAGIKARLKGSTWMECLAFAKDLAKKLADKLIAAGKFIAATLMTGNGNALRCYTAENPPDPEEEPCWMRRLCMVLFRVMGMDPGLVQNRVTLSRY